MKLESIINFRSDKLFNGAVNIDWFNTDSTKSKLASEAYVFHGPNYHGVNQSDVGEGHGHKLTDTASFARTIVKRCFGLDETPFTLAIAGYGTGKSHLGLTLANLISSPKSKVSESILQSISIADKEIAYEIQKIIENDEQRPMVIALNGMSEFNLAAEITKQIIATLKKDNLDTSPFDELRPRFKQAVSLVELSNDTVKNELLKLFEVKSIETLIDKLIQQDEIYYAKVYSFFEKKGMPISALSGESLKDVIDTAVRLYCGENKYYKSILFIFDEFGKYTEFASVKSHISGSGALQELYEGIQSHSEYISFLGFIQFELNAYVARIAPEFKNEIIRYVTRYQAADKLFLSVNIETLIANLIEKKKPELLEEKFDHDGKAYSHSEEIMEKMKSRFPAIHNYNTWNNLDVFHSIIRKGCWPLSPYSTWLLYYFTAAGKHLQERSALALLGNIFKSYQDAKIDLVDTWLINPVEFCTNEFINELISSEESGHQGSIAQSYLSINSKYGERFSRNQRSILKSILISSKLGIINSDRNEALDAILDFTGIQYDVIQNEIVTLQYEYNVIEWDESFKVFDIIGEAVPKTQFLSYLKKQVNSVFDKESKSVLFSTKAATWCDHLKSIDCDFAEEHKITTREWNYSAITTNLNSLIPNLIVAHDRWSKAIDVDQTKGTIIYCYLNQSSTVESAKEFTISKLKEITVNPFPVIITFLYDNTGYLGQYLAELSIIEEMQAEDKAKFGNLIVAHKLKLENYINETVKKLISEQNVVTQVSISEDTRLLRNIGNLVFANIYKKIISFPFDGFSTPRGNAADSCFDLTSELLYGRLNYNQILAKPVKVRNRAIAVLNETWAVFNKDGSISRRPGYEHILELFEKWDEILNKDNEIVIESMLKELLMPPYGANIASAGLILGVYINPRIDELMVLSDGTMISIQQLHQNGIFRTKFLNISAIRNLKLIKIQNQSSEWDLLFDEWEKCETYESKLRYLENAQLLRERIPLPPIQVHRFENLKNITEQGVKEIISINEEVEKAWAKIDKGLEREDCSLLSHGASILKGIADKMEEEEAFWIRNQIEEVRDGYTEARQYTINFFDNWLIKQAPNSTAPSVVGDFKNHMINRVARNLEKINLTKQKDKLIDYTEETVKKTEQIVIARDLITRINIWLSENTNAVKKQKINEIKCLIREGINFTQKLKDTLKTGIKIQNSNDLQVRIEEFVGQLKELEENIAKKANALWESEIRSETDIDSFLLDVNSLVNSYEGLDEDIDDFVVMRKALNLFKECNHKITNSNNTWKQFNEIKESLLAKCENELSEEEIPWDYENVIKTLHEGESTLRTERSNEWVKGILKNGSTIKQMDASAANQLLNQISSHPNYITEEGLLKLNNLQVEINKRLNGFKMDWLIEKFNELEEEKKVEFVAKIQKLLNQRK